MPFDANVDAVAALLAELPAIWGFCGGWAIDLFLGRVMRQHKDVDVAVLRREQSAVFSFLRDPAIRRPLSATFFHVSSAYPLLAPEIVLLYKSKHAANEGNRADFAHARPALNAERRRWLADALERTAPGHEWIAPLRGGA